MIKKQEQQSAMVLAQRAYLFGLYRVVFGGGFNAESTVKVFSQETLESLHWLENILENPQVSGIALEELTSFRMTVRDAIRENIVCVKSIMQQENKETLVCLLIDAHSKLFRVPGTSYVRPWESAYVGTKDMLFQESTLDVRQRYHEAYLKLSAEGHFPDDHVATIMEYEARMSERAYAAYSNGDGEKTQDILEAQRGMLESHVLTWIDDFTEEVAKKDSTDIFSAFAFGLAAFCALEQKRCLCLELQGDGALSSKDFRHEEER